MKTTAPAGIESIYLPLASRSSLKLTDTGVSDSHNVLLTLVRSRKSFAHTWRYTLVQQSSSVHLVVSATRVLSRLRSHREEPWVWGGRLLRRSWFT